MPFLFGIIEVSLEKREAKSRAVIYYEWIAAIQKKRTHIKKGWKAFKRIFEFFIAYYGMGTNERIKKISQFFIRFYFRCISSADKYIYTHFHITTFAAFHLFFFLSVSFDIKYIRKIFSRYLCWMVWRSIADEIPWDHENETDEQKRERITAKRKKCGEWKLSKRYLFMLCAWNGLFAVLIFAQLNVYIYVYLCTMPYPLIIKMACIN